MELKSQIILQSFLVLITEVISIRTDLSSIFIVLVGVVMDYKMEEQGCMSLSSTDAEINATFADTKRA